MKYLLITLIVLTSCSPAAKLRRAEKLIAKAELQGAKWKVDTVYKTIEVPVLLVKKDTIFKSAERDTVVITKDRLKIKYVKLPGDSVYIEGECKSDTIKVNVPVTVTKTIKAEANGFKWWHLILALLVGGFIVKLMK